MIQSCHVFYETHNNEPNAEAVQVCQVPVGTLTTMQAYPKRHKVQFNNRNGSSCPMQHQSPSAKSRTSTNDHTTHTDKEIARQENRCELLLEASDYDTPIERHKLYSCYAASLSASRSGTAFQQTRGTAKCDWAPDRRVTYMQTQATT